MKAFKFVLNVISFGIPLLLEVLRKNKTLKEIVDDKAIVRVDTNLQKVYISVVHTGVNLCLSIDYLQKEGEGGYDE